MREIGIMLVAVGIAAVGAAEPVDPKLVATLYVTKVTFEPKKIQKCLRWECDNRLGQSCSLSVSRTDDFLLHCGDTLIPARGNLSDLPLSPTRLTIKQMEGRVSIHYGP